MKKALAVVAMLVTTNTFAYYENPHQQFDMTHNDTNKVEITFRTSNNINQTCQAESRARGLGNFGYSVEACSFWNYDKSQCTIITSPTANFHTIGHEVRHCLQGNFHK
jgi:hypothetical protein